jgi:hypothetical protein
LRDVRTCPTSPTSTRPLSFTTSRPGKKTDKNKWWYCLLLRVDTAHGICC